LISCSLILHWPGLLQLVLVLAVVDGELLVGDVEGGQPAARAAAPRLARPVTTSRWTWGGGA
jgi:hypothetical protein